MAIRARTSDDVFLPFRKQLDGGGKYAVVNPRRLYRGKSYSDWTTDWFNWFLSANADMRNFGPVVFLRSHGLPHKDTEVSEPVNSSDRSSDSSSDNHITENDYPTGYVNDANIRVGNDRLQIFEDQPVFVPIIVAYQLGGTVATYRDWGNMQDQVGSIIDNGDNPPEPMQLTIDNIPISLADGNGGSLLMEDFRITTPIFTAIVPEAPYKTSIKDFLEEGSLPAGTYPSIVDGYFVMLKFNAGTYWVHSWASAALEARGPYFSELLYQIEVGTRPAHVPHGRITAVRPARNQGLLEHLALKKSHFNELTAKEAKKLKGYFGSLNELEQRVSTEEARQLEKSKKNKKG